MKSGEFRQKSAHNYAQIADFYHEMSSLLKSRSKQNIEPLEELTVALEELNVAQEELLQQNKELEQARTQVETERQRYQDLFELAPDGYIVTDDAGTIQQANRAAAELLKVPQQYLAGKPLMIFIPSSELLLFHLKLSQLKQGEKIPEWELNLKPRWGNIFTAAITLSELPQPQNNSVSWLWLIRDISDRKRTEATNQMLKQELWKQQQTEAILRESEARFRSLFENSPVAYMLLDDQGRYLDVNEQLCNLLGYTSEELLGKSFGEFWSPEMKPFFDQQFVYSKNNEIMRLEVPLIAKNGDQLTVLLEGRNIYHKNCKFVKTHCILYNITERKLIEEDLRHAHMELGRINQELKHLVNIDALTQIANRRCFDRVLEKEWQRLQREQQPLSLILFDVDYFKLYNDYYGHQKGDQCLFKIAQAVKEAVYRSADLVARYGGEEFAIILPNVNTEGAIEVINRIQTSISSLGIPHQQSPVSDVVTVSFGVASLVPEKDRSFMLISQADQALYKAKQQGRNQYIIAT
ncbi:sensor domain-containing diguanylate cyclase [Aphanothece hegewaldii]|nr:sensor domain-containing diguanylate cyclase [Aphanothece hegewaldii]